MKKLLMLFVLALTSVAIKAEVTAEPTDKIFVGCPPGMTYVPPNPYDEGGCYPKIVEKVQKADEPTVTVHSKSPTPSLGPEGSPSNQFPGCPTCG